MNVSKMNKSAVLLSKQLKVATNSPTKCELRLVANRQKQANDKWVDERQPTKWSAVFAYLVEASGYAPESKILLENISTCLVYV